jgi:drug/metabolite transporter (DMT)-like permease
MLWVQFVAAMTVTPIAALSGHTHVPQGIDWLWMTLIVFGTGVGSHILINWAHPYVDVSISSLMMLAVPVVAGIAAWVLLGESMTALQILGTLVTIAAMVGVVRGGGARRDGASAAAEAY